MSLQSSSVGWRNRDVESHSGFIKRARIAETKSESTAVATDRCTEICSE